MLTLYDYFRSTASYRVRIALNLKALSYDLIPIHLVNNGGEQLKPEYQMVNPQGLVPSLKDPDLTSVLTQSLAIIEYLDEKYPTPALLPKDLQIRAQVRAFAQVIACEMHPLNNLRVLKYLKHQLSVSEEQKQQWYHHWLSEGFNALEKMLQNSNHQGPYCFGDEITMADVFLIPQVYNADRFEFPMNDFPLIRAIQTQCLQHPAFIQAAPENQVSQ
jgi:maleylacetoacetate isomerase